jgi:tetratricopeptide (TPR) repeat protein
MLGNQLAAAGDRGGAIKAYARHAKLCLRELKLIEEATAGNAEDLPGAEQMLLQALDINPTDVVARRTLGELYLRLGKVVEAEEALRRALELVPRCADIRYQYAVALTHQTNWKGANTQLKLLLEQSPGDRRVQSFLAANLIMLGERDEAFRMFEQVRNAASNDTMFWLNYGHAARSVGQANEAIIAAYRKCVELDPSYGTAWWALADLKTYRFSPAEIATMRDQLKRGDIPDGQRCHLEFALGNALEVEGAYAESFEHYQRANALRRPYAPHDADLLHRDVLRGKAFYSRQFFSTREGAGCPAPDPIFIVGMPRAGSTLIEQILASHSQVEGTMELPDLGDMVADLIQQYRPAKPFPELLDGLNEEELRKLGEEYLRRTQSQRKLGRPFFTDKAGKNFYHVGLIRVILPNAKIVDSRRHPLACGFSCYRQAFAPGAMHLAYDQTHIGRYYRDYVEMMAHYDEVIPGRVHRVFHENLVSEPETEIRRLLEFCGLPFEEQCLRFYETDRSVRTASSQQVRQPIQKKKVEIWQHYEAWLQPMKDALGDVLTSYPNVPAAFTEPEPATHAVVSSPDGMAKAAQMLRQPLDSDPADAAAAHTLGVRLLQQGNISKAEAALRRAVEIDPSCLEARYTYSTVLAQQQNWKSAIEQLQIILKRQPGNPRVLSVLAANMVMLGEGEGALRLLEKAQPLASSDPVFWLNYGHVAKALGKGNDAIAQAYRNCIELDPANGEAWWGLSDLKTYRFSPAEILTLREQLAHADLGDDQRCHLEFALGSALENEGAYEESFEHYRRANELRRPYGHYNPDITHRDVIAFKSLYTPEFFSARKGMGCQSPDPIFIVGMPRSGSTLTEQILASHSLVEGTMELPDLGNIFSELVQRNVPRRAFPEFLAALDGETLRGLGAEYLTRTRAQRKLRRPFFTDKTGNNFFHVGLIQLILPNAKIVDVRRHPLACGFSCYKQDFALGAMHLACDQTHIGRYYRDYAALMAHYDKVLPGRVHRMIHEEFLADPQGEIRRLLEFCGLPFEEQCLHFHETDRIVRTASSQQVRQPIQIKKVEVWQHYEAWLQPMKDALGDVLTSYPHVPKLD